MYSYLDCPSVYLFDYICPRQVWCIFLHTGTYFYYPVTDTSTFFICQPCTDDGDHGSISRNLLQDKPHITEEMARGYMSNAELEIAVHAFGSRCSNISRIYRDNTNILSALERVWTTFHCGWSKYQTNPGKEKLNQHSRFVVPFSEWLLKWGCSYSKFGECK